MPRITLKNYNQESRLFSQRVIMIAAIIGVLSFSILIRLFYLQVFQHGKYTHLSNKNQMALIPIEPNRGLIYDRNGVLLAENIPSFSLDIIPTRVADLNRTLLQLQDLLHLDDELIDQFYRHKRQHRPFEPVSLKLKLTEEELAKFYVNQFRFPGVMVNARMTRHYPLGENVVNVLGYVSRINEKELKSIDPVNYSASNFIGKVGIERFYEATLHGTVGYEQIEVNATGQTVRVQHFFPPIPGDDLHLSIDSDIQLAAHKALGSERGAVVAIDPNNGEVLALVSHPSFDPNLFVNGISNKNFQALQQSPDKPLYNRAIRGQYPFASTIKPFLALAGLENDVITTKTHIDDPGYFKLPNNDHLYRDWKHTGHGWVNLFKAITVSCDTYFYVLSLKLGMHHIHSMLTRFGFGELTNIDMKEELSGLVPSPEWKQVTQHAPWYTGDTIISGIGQGFMLTTPLQLASGTAALGMHGKRYQPHLLIRSHAANGEDTIKPIVELPSIELKKPNNWDIIIRAMHNVIVGRSPYGTGFRFGETKYDVAAKTGTGQIYRPAKYADLPEIDVPLKYRDHSLFIAFAPIKHPKIAVAIIIENSNHAARVARKVMDAYLAKPTKPQKSDKA